MERESLVAADVTRIGEDTEAEVLVVLAGARVVTLAFDDGTEVRVCARELRGALEPLPAVRRAAA